MNQALNKAANTPGLFKDPFPLRHLLFVEQRDEYRKKKRERKKRKREAAKKKARSDCPLNFNIQGAVKERVYVIEKQEIKSLPTFPRGSRSSVERNFFRVRRGKIILMFNRADWERYPDEKTINSVVSQIF